MKPGAPGLASETCKPLPRYNLSMSRTAAEILEEARQLSPGDQDWLVESLLIKDKDESAEEVEAAWDSEIKRRLDEIDSGAVEMLPLEEVLARMDAKVLSRQQG
jgi:putative addiction module component (TIGR02574 family)